MIAQAEEEREQKEQEAVDEAERQQEEQYGHLIAQVKDEKPETKRTWQEQVIISNKLNDLEQLARDFNHYCSSREHGKTHDKALEPFDEFTAKIICDLNYKLEIDRPRLLSEDTPFNVKDMKLLLQVNN